MSTITLSGFGDKLANGVYTLAGSNLYRKEGYYIKGVSSYMPYLDKAAFVVVKAVLATSPLAIVVDVPEYYTLGVDVTVVGSMQWVSLLMDWTNESQIGSVVYSA